LRIDPKYGEKEQLFAYAGNNPIVYIDAEGLDHLEFIMTTPYGKRGMKGILIWCKQEKDTRKPSEPPHWVEAGRWNAVSGSDLHSHIPQGFYIITNIINKIPDRRFCPSTPCSAGSTMCWEAYIGPRPTPPPRYGIHPDGGCNGTAGCIGIQDEGSDELYKKLKEYLDINGTMGLLVRKGGRLGCQGEG